MTIHLHHCHHHTNPLRDHRNRETVPSRHGSNACHGSDRLEQWAPTRTVRDHRGGESVPSRYGSSSSSNSNSNSNGLFGGLFQAVKNLAAFGGGRDWGSMVANGDVDSVIDAAARGDRSAKKWLEKPENQLILQRKMQEEARLFQLQSNIMRLRHDEMKTAIGNIRV